MRVLNERQIDIADFPVAPSGLASLLKLVDSGAISGSIAKTVFEEMLTTGKDPETIVREKGLTQISDKGDSDASSRKWSTPIRAKLRNSAPEKSRCSDSS